MGSRHRQLLLLTWSVGTPAPCMGFPHPNLAPGRLTSGDFCLGNISGEAKKDVERKYMGLEPAALRE